MKDKKRKSRRMELFTSCSIVYDWLLPLVTPTDSG